MALRGDTGLALAHEYTPDAIVLDLNLPVLDGGALLDRLKHHPATRHIPVHIVSSGDGRQQALRAGAAAYLEKPVSREGLGDAFSSIATSSSSRTTTTSGSRSSSSWASATT